MSKALEVYAANYGHSHEAGVEAVWKVAYDQGVADATNTPPVEPEGVTEPAESGQTSDSASDSTDGTQPAQNSAAPTGEDTQVDGGS